MELNEYFDESSIESVDERIDAERALAGLSVRDRRVIYLSFSDYTQAEISEMAGLSDRQVRRILAKLSTFTPATR